jgi:hypothetical protein
MHDEALYADRVLRAGGDGYIMKQEDLKNSSARCATFFPGSLTSASVSLRAQVANPPSAAPGESQVPWTDSLIQNSSS